MEENELATGGMIEDSGIAIVGEPGPNLAFPGTATVMPNPTLLNPSGIAATNMYVGDVPWQYIPPPPPWLHQPTITPVPIHVEQPAAHTLTEDDIRALVAKWLRDDPDIRAVLDDRRHDIVDTRQQRRVRQWDQDGTEWRGVLYKVNKEE